MWKIIFVVVNIIAAYLLINLICGLWQMMIYKVRLFFRRIFKRK